MRRFALAVCALVFCILLAVPALAAPAATKTSVFATVSPDGSCQVTVTATVHMDEVDSDLSYPLPKNASGITLNGSRVHTRSQGNAKLVSLSGITGKVTGDFTLNMTYTLKNVLEQTEIGALQARIPLLCGFSYPTGELEFSITLPGAVEEKPAFSSGYHQANIEQSMEWDTVGAAVSGRATAELKDHETLEITIPVTKEMFTQARIRTDYQPNHLWMWGALGLAILYWLIFLPFLPPRCPRSSLPPDGFGAGQMRTVLLLQGADLDLMVLGWAQEGYVTLSVSGKETVRITRQTEMGGERSEFEQRVFRNLFSGGDTVNCSGNFYIRQWEKTHFAAGNRKLLMEPGRGNVRIFRILGALPAVCGGVFLGMALGSGSVLQIFWAVILGIIGGIGGWYIHPWAEELLLYGKRKRIRAAVIAGLWLLMGLIAGLFSTAVIAVLSQLIVGLGAAFCGRRNDWGVDAFSRTVGFRRYLRSVKREDLIRICDQNPEYFYSLAPYAMALRMDRKLAKKLGRKELPPCTYLHYGVRQEEWLNAGKWSARMRRTLSAMSARRLRRPVERFMKMLRSFSLSVGRDRY